ncbi:MAG: hypothetical protein HY343_00630 [Lentisphaerae bacterium]|nr:hypothetical protein [Lentisphaerota bacterium]
MTAFRYMQLTGKMLIEGYSEDGKCNTVLHLKDGHAGLLVKMLSAAPSAFTPEHVRKIVPKIRELVEGRTLSQLYFDFGVTKPRQTKDVKVHKRLGPAPTPSVYATDWVDRALAVLGQVGTFEKHLEEADLNRIVDGLKWTLECLGAGEQLHAEFRVIEPQDLTREGKSDEGRVSSVGGGR